MPRQGHKHNVLHQKEEVTQNKFKEVTYKRVACEVREGKPNKNRTRLTVGGDRIKKPGNCGITTSDLLTVKLLLNNVISTLGEKLTTLDTKIFYLNTPLARY